MSEIQHGGSNRSFGQVFAFVFLVIGLWPLTGGGDVRLWCLAIAAVFLILAYTAPDVMAPLNRVWTKIGILLHKIVNPIIMGVLFYILVAPFGLVRRWIGKADPMQMRPDQDASSYWEPREPLERDHMRQQF